MCFSCVETGVVIVSVKMFTLPLEEDLLLEEAAPFTGPSLVLLFSNFYSGSTLFFSFLFFIGLVHSVSQHSF